MNTVLWVVQILLALSFLYHGWMMLALAQPPLPYILAIPVPSRRFIGVAEILAGVGLVLPSLTRILPWLTPLAAVGLVIVMVGAVIFHVPRKEYPNIVFNVILLVLAAFVAYGRFVAAPL